jgi:hypothetical protein
MDASGDFLITLEGVALSRRKPEVFGMGNITYRIPRPFGMVS